MATSRMADQVGRVLGGRYRLVSPIGTGASADVFLAEDVTLRRRVAVKVLHAALAEDEAFLRRFRAEAQQAAALNHPNIMRVFDWGESDDGPYLVLEHLAGGSLRDLLDEGRLLSPSQALLVGLEAARALDYAHRRGLVHRDVKPANLLFDDEGRLCIADFGLARALAEAAWTEPVGALLGTARYASPEQAQGLAVDGKADVYALALVLVEAVTGQVPFSADTTIATLMARVGNALAAPPEVGVLGPVLEKAAAPQAAERLDARQLAIALDDLAKHLPTPEPLPLARPRTPDAAVVLDGSPAGDVTELGIRPPAPAAAPGKAERAAAAPAGEGPPAAPAVELLPAAFRRRPRWPWLVLVALLAAMVAGIAYAVAQARVPTHPVPTLRGKTLPEARAAASAAGKFEVTVGPRKFDEEVPENLVVDQDPALGELREGGEIKVVLSKGPEPRAVPDLAGLDQAAAEQRLRERGFVPRVVLEPSEDRPKGAVLAWSPTGTLPKGTDVLLTVSDGPAPREVPDLAGRTFDEAALALAQQGLKAVKAEAFSSDVDAGRVISTRPGPGAKAAKDSNVTVIVSKGPEIVSVPNVTGRTEQEAAAALQAAGLRVGGVFGPPRPQRRVIATAPQAGAQVERGTAVDLFVR